MDRRAETDFDEGRRNQLGAGVRESDAAIQSGSCLVALIALALLIGWLFNTWEAFQKSVPLLRPGRLSAAVEKIAS